MVSAACHAVAHATRPAGDFAVPDANANANTPTPPNPHLVLWLIYGYMVLIHPVLVGVLYKLYGAGQPFDAGALRLPAVSDRLGLGLSLAGVCFFAIGFIVPRKWAQKSRGNAAARDTAVKPFLPYILTLSLLELCTVMGFVLGLLQDQWQPALPLAVLGLVGVLLSPPTPAFFDRFAGNGTSH